MPLERSDDFASVGVVSISMIESSPKRESSEKSEKSEKSVSKSEDEPPKSWSSDCEKP